MKASPRKDRQGGGGGQAIHVEILFYALLVLEIFKVEDDHRRLIHDCVNVISRVADEVSR